MKVTPSVGCVKYKAQHVVLAVRIPVLIGCKWPRSTENGAFCCGFSREGADKAFMSCRLAGSAKNSEGVKNEESESHPDIFVCGAPRLSWPEFWKKYQSYG